MKPIQDHKADIDAIWDSYFAEVDQYKDDTLDLRWELKGHINGDEWEAIFSSGQADDD